MTIENKTKKRILTGLAIIAIPAGILFYYLLGNLLYFLIF
jgi:hypothetical protein